MSFTFGFTSQDLGDDGLVVEKPFNGSSTASNDTNPLDSARLVGPDVLQPGIEPWKEVLHTLKDVRLSFEEFSTPTTGTVLFRREVFDVKHQLMTEDSETDRSEDVDILIGSTAEDVRSNVYEGGIKSWECSVDLVDHLAKTNLPYDCFLELGSGTSLPTEYCFTQCLKSQPTGPVNFILSDYNKSVLRLVTLPNILISWAKLVLSLEEWSYLQQTADPNIPIRTDELLVSEPLIQRFIQDMEQRQISFTLISGTWGRKFSNLVKPLVSSKRGILVMSSETIYQPQNLPVVAETLFDLISHAQSHQYNINALVAAKDIYFGVGGTVVEFENYLTQKITQGALGLTFQTSKVAAGLKRSIISIQ